jgi:transposase
VDETTFMRATGQHPTMYATGIADLTPGRPARLLDVVAGRSGAVLATWLGERDDQWKAQIATASLDPFRGYATALNQQLRQAVRVLNPFHVTKLGLTAVDQMRRRVQQDVHGIGVIVATRFTGSAASCVAAPTGSASGPGAGYEPVWSPAPRTGS